MDKNFTVLHKILQASSTRQKVLASNVANAETPGYKSKDVKFSNFLGKEMELKATNSKHIKSKNSGSNGNVVVRENPSWGDGNNVELNAEVGKMQENSLTHNAAIKIINSKIGMYKSAIKGGR